MLEDKDFRQKHIALESDLAKHKTAATETETESCLSVCLCLSFNRREGGRETDRQTDGDRDRQRQGERQRQTHARVNSIRPTYHQHRLTTVAFNFRPSNSAQTVFFFLSGPQEAIPIWLERALGQEIVSRSDHQGWLSTRPDSFPSTLGGQVWAERVVCLPLLRLAIVMKLPR